MHAKNNRTIYITGIEAIISNSSINWFDFNTSGGTAPFYASKEGFFF